MMRALDEVVPLPRGAKSNLLDVDLPRNAVVHPTVVDLHGQVSALVEPPKLCIGRVRALGEGLEEQLAYRTPEQTQRNEEKHVPCWCFLDCRTHTQWGFVYGRRTVLHAVSRTNGETCFVPVEAMWSNAEAHNGNDEPQALKNLETADDLFARFCLGTGTRFT